MRTKIIYEDNYILVCHKPAGLATQTAHIGQQDVVSELKNYLAKSGNMSPNKMSSSSENKTGSLPENRIGSLPGGKAAASRGNKAVQAEPYFGVVHRLDQPVEGLLVFAKTKEAAAKLAKQLSAGILNKQYYAIICGKPFEKSGELVDYLVKEGSIGRIGNGEEKEAKRAILQYKILKDWNGECSLADVRIETGRFHQIRLQLAHAGYPILGDLKYGTRQSIELSWKYQVKNVALYAYRIEFYHPITGKKLDFMVQPVFPMDSTIRE